MICDASAPSASGNGRDRLGRFVKGHKLAKGNPFAGRVARLRAALLAAVEPEDIAEIARVVITKAKAGDPAMIRLLWSYVLGEPAKLLDDLARRSPAAVLPRSTVRELIGAEQPQPLLPFGEPGPLDRSSPKC